MIGSADTAGNKSETPVLELRGLGFGYEPGRQVVADFSASVRAGELCVVLGPNAAGKSTLLKLMLGRLAPSAGSVLLAGQDVARIPPRRRAALMSYVPQRGGSTFAFTVRQVVALGRFALRPDPAAVENALAWCSLAELTERPYNELSVGQQQRVLLARAIAQSAGQGRVLLLDEPGSAMDLRHVHAVMERLLLIARGGLAVVVVLHDLNLAARYADRLWLMDQGRLVADGGWRDVLRPEILQPVYRVRIASIDHAASGRPVLAAEPMDTLLTSPAWPGCSGNVR